MGEHISILGANGSGKSTLLKILDLVLPYRDGRLTILGYDGKDRKSIRKIRSRIGLVFQNPESSFICKTVIDEVMFSSLNFNIPRDLAYKNALLALKVFNLSKYENENVKDLSGGEKQRLMLASVFALDPEIIILDEAFAFLDVSSKELLLSVLENKKREGKGIINVTHDAQSASSSDRTILLKGGRIIKNGGTDDVLKDVSLLISSEVRPLACDMLGYLMGTDYD